MNIEDIFVNSGAETPIMNYDNLLQYDACIKELINSLNAIQDNKIATQELLLAYLKEYVLKSFVESSNKDYVTVSTVDASLYKADYINPIVKKVIDASNAKGLAIAEDLYQLFTQRVGLDSSMQITWDVKRKCDPNASIVEVLNNLKTDFNVVTDQTTYAEISEMIEINTYPVFIEDGTGKAFLYYGAYSNDTNENNYYFIAFNDTEFKMYICSPNNEWTTDTVYYATKETIETIDASISNINTEISKIKRYVRFLSVWDCETGKPKSEPDKDPYDYLDGDYYIVSKVSADPSANLIPDGSIYHRGSTSTKYATENIYVGDKFYFDSSVWVPQSGHEQLIPVDEEIDASSKNPAENKAIYKEFEDTRLVLISAINKLKNDIDSSLIANYQNLADKIYEFKTDTSYTDKQYPSAKAVQDAIVNLEYVTSHALFDLSEDISDLSTYTHNNCEVSTNKITKFVTGVVYNDNQYPSAHAVQEAIEDTEFTLVQAILDASARIDKCEVSANKITEFVEGTEYTDTQYPSAKAVQVLAEEIEFVASLGLQDACTRIDEANASISRINTSINNINTTLNNKVDKISGKGLSTNDFTNEYLNKLNGIAANAQVNVLESVKVDGTPLSITNKYVNIETTDGATPTNTPFVKRAYLDSSYAYIIKAIEDDEFTINMAMKNKVDISVLDASYYQKAHIDTSINAINNNKADKATTLSGYGITDAKIYNNTITLGSNTMTVVDNLSTQSSNNPLSANMGYDLQRQINDTKALGRFLSIWNCSTGKPATQPQVDVYNYHTGDYFIVGAISSSTGINYRPDGSTYTKDSTSSVQETGEVAISDQYVYDGSVWMLQMNHAKSIAVDGSLSTTSENPVQNKVVTAAINLLNASVNALDASCARKLELANVEFTLVKAIQLIDTSLGKVDASVTILNASINEKANKTYVDTADTALNTSISNLKTYVDNGLSVKVDTSVFNASILSINTALAKKADSSTTLDGYGITDAVKSVNKLTPDASGNVNIRTFSDVPPSMNEFKGSSTDEFCSKFSEIVNPDGGTAFLTGDIAFTDLPLSMRGGNCELIIYVPTSGVYVLEISSTDSFESLAGSVAGKWMAMWCNSVVMNWHGLMTCPEAQIENGDYKYIPQQDSDGVSKYWFDSSLALKADKTEVNIALAKKADSSTTLDGYGITDAVKSVNKLTPDASGNVDVAAFSAVPSSMSTYKNSTTSTYLTKFTEIVRPTAGSAYLAHVGLSDMPCGSGEIFIYVPVADYSGTNPNIVYVVELTSTNSFAPGYGDTAGKWMAIYQDEQGHGATARMSWKGVLTCPYTTVSGKRVYAPAEDSDAVSKYWFDSSLALKADKTYVDTSLGLYVLKSVYDASIAALEARIAALENALTIQTAN